MELCRAQHWVNSVQYLIIRDSLHVILQGSSSIGCPIPPQVWPPSSRPLCLMLESSTLACGGYPPVRYSRARSTELTHDHFNSMRVFTTARSNTHFLTLGLCVRLPVALSRRWWT